MEILAIFFVGWCCGDPCSLAFWEECNTDSAKAFLLILMSPLGWLILGLVKLFEYLNKKD